MRRRMHGKLQLGPMLLVMAVAGMAGQPTADQLLGRVKRLPARYRRIQLAQDDSDLTTIGMTTRMQALTEALLGDAAVLKSAHDNIPVREAWTEIERDLDGIARYVDVERNWRHEGGSITGNLCAAQALAHVERLIGWQVRKLYGNDDRLDTEAWLASWAAVCELEAE